MKRFMYTMAAALALLLMIGLVPVLSQDGMGGGEDDGMDPEKAWEEVSKPGEEHKMLAKMAGEWEVTGKGYKMGADGKPVAHDIKGTSTCKLIHDRFLFEEMTHEMDGKKSSGTGMMGYDNDAKEWQACYVGEWATGMYLYRGKMSDDGKTLTMGVEYTCNAFGGAKMKERLISTAKSDDEHTFEMYMTFGDTPEMKVMEVTYKRKK